MESQLRSKPQARSKRKSYSHLFSGTNWSEVVGQTMEAVSLIPADIVGTSSRDKSTPALGDEKRLAQFTHRQMILNSRSQISITLQTLLTRPVVEKKYDAASFRSFIEALNLFKSVVGYRRPWDFKDSIRESYGNEVVFAGRSIAFDAWSNIHYGYVGRAASFPVHLLLIAAGGAQILETGPLSGWLTRFFQNPGEPFLILADDEKDQTAIKFGIHLFEVYGLNLSLDEFKLELSKATRVR